MGGLCAAVMVAAGADGCRKDVGDSAGASRMEGASMTVQTDLEKLRKRINLPPGNFPCRWVTAAVAPSGGSGLPGPTDTRTYAFVALDGPRGASYFPRGASPHRRRSSSARRSGARFFRRQRSQERRRSKDE